LPGADFIESADRSCIATELLVESPSEHANVNNPEEVTGLTWLTDPTPATAYVAGVLAFANSVKTARPLALHLDVKPHTLPGGLTAQRRNEFLLLLDAVKAARGNNHLDIVADIPVSWDAVIHSNHPFDELVIDRVDEVVLTETDDNAVSINLAASHEIAYASAKGKRVVIGVETQHPTLVGDDVPDHWKLAPGKTFFEEGESVMKAALTQVATNFVSSAAFAGVAFHDHDSWKQLGDTKMRLAIPSYSDGWGIAGGEDTLYPAFPAVPRGSIMVLNPSDGDNAESDAEAVANLAAATARGIMVLGYVYTENGTRDKAAVMTDIANHYTNYPEISGIFFDEVAHAYGEGSEHCDSTDARTFYKDVAKFARDEHAEKAHGAAFLVGNPGVKPCESFTNYFEVLVNFERSAASYNTPGEYIPGAWAAAYPPSRFWHLVHDADEMSLNGIVATAAQRNVAWIYVTDDIYLDDGDDEDPNNDNPWDNLATYISQEAALVAAAIP